MTASSNEVLERARVREVAAIFHSRAALHEANDALLLAGFDRSDIDCLAELDQVYGELGSVYVAAEDLADISRVPRQPVLEPEDVTGARAVIVGIIAVLGAGAAAFAVLIATLGFLGGLVMSAVKRDRGIKDWSDLIPGHGGMLDRVDSLCFSAPVFFHLTRYFFS